MLDRAETLNKLNEGLDSLTDKVEEISTVLQDSDRGFFAEYEALVSYLASVLLSLNAKLDDLTTRDADE
jgi:hypothetical protein